MHEKMSEKIIQAATDLFSDAMTASVLTRYNVSIEYSSHVNALVIWAREKPFSNDSPFAPAFRSFLGEPGTEYLFLDNHTEAEALDALADLRARVQTLYDTANGVRPEKTSPAFEYTPTEAY
jgi:Arc/MetJ family transcription regulator